MPDVISVTSFVLRAMVCFFFRNALMEKLPEVEAAKALMTEAVAWSVMKWLREKKRVRKTADLANAALDRLSETTKARWPEGLRLAYEA